MKLSPQLLMLIGVVSVGAAAPLIRASATAPLTAAFLRTLIGGAVLLAIVLAARRPLPAGKDRWRALAAGVVLGVHFALWFASLARTTVAASTVLVCIQPIFVALFARIALNERPTRRALLGIGVALAGSTIIALDGGGGPAAPDPLLGNALALAGAAVIAIYPLIGRRLSTNVDTLGYSATVTLTAAATLACVCTAFGAPLFDPHANGVALLGLALLPTVVGQTALNAALRTLSAAEVSGAILGEPVVATAIAWLAFSERPGLQTLAGAGLTLVGLAILLRRGTR